MPEDTEAQVHKWSSHLVLSKISQISLEKYMCWSLYLRKLQALRLANLLKRDSNTGIFLWNKQDFQELFFYKHLRWLFLKHATVTFCSIFYNQQLSQWQTIFKNAFTYQKLVSIERFCNWFRTNSKGSDLNINNFAVLLHFRIT